MGPVLKGLAVDRRPDAAGEQGGPVPALLPVAANPRRKENPT